MFKAVICIRRVDGNFNCTVRTNNSAKLEKDVRDIIERFPSDIVDDEDNAEEVEDEEDDTEVKEKEPKYKITINVTNGDEKTEISRKSNDVERFKSDIIRFIAVFSPPAAAPLIAPAKPTPAAPLTAPAKPTPAASTNSKMWEAPVFGSSFGAPFTFGSIKKGDTNPFSSFPSPAPTPALKPILKPTFLQEYEIRSQRSLSKIGITHRNEPMECSMDTD
jgi:hypothetical protein